MERDEANHLRLSENSDYNYKIVLGKRVAVLGGGDTATDVARN